MVRKETIDAQLPKKILDSINRLQPSMIKDRRHFHKHPELSFQEYGTVEYIKKRLGEMSVPYNVTSNGLGIIAKITGIKSSQKTKSIAFRSDIDALPIDELSHHSYRSVNPGVMHACGHDSHTAIILGLIESMAQNREFLMGDVIFIFQHAEETPPGGAIEILELLDHEAIHSIYGLHVTNELPVGMIGLCEGSYMAASDSFSISIRGTGGHGALPGTVQDTVSAAASLINSINQITSRGFPVIRDTIVSICSIHGGNSYNVIPGEVTLQGTIRTFQHEAYRRIIEKIQKIVVGTSSIYDTTITLRESKGYPALINNSEKISLIRTALSKYTRIQYEDIAPTPVGEDFSVYLQKIPGAFFRLGTHGSIESSFPLHHNQFDIDENALGVGLTAYWSIYLTECLNTEEE